MAKVRPATPDDFPALAEQIASLPLMQRYGQTAERLSRAWTQALAKGDGFFVYDDRGVKGLAWFMTSGTLGVGGYLRLIAVVPNQQTHGAGSALLEVFERETFANSANAFLLVSDFNDGAQRFYERHGYSRSGALPDLVVPGITELLYWKKRPT